MNTMKTHLKTKTFETEDLSGDYKNGAGKNAGVNSKNKCSCEYGGHCHQSSLDWWLADQDGSPCCGHLAWFYHQSHGSEGSNTAEISYARLWDHLKSAAKSWNHTQKEISNHQNVHAHESGNPLFISTHECLGVVRSNSLLYFPSLFPLIDRCDYPLASIFCLVFLTHGQAK